MDLSQMIKLIINFGVSTVCSRVSFTWILYFNEKKFTNTKRTARYHKYAAARFKQTKPSTFTAYYRVCSIQHYSREVQCKYCYR